MPPSNGAEPNFYLANTLARRIAEPKGKTGFRVSFGKCSNIFVTLLDGRVIVTYFTSR
jgi:hypothetical protein